MVRETTQILDEVAGYYSGKLAQHGASPPGVDWNGRDSQFARFEQLSKVIVGDAAFSLNDVGCGYGALHDFLADRYENFAYWGVDIVPDMVAAAKQRLPATDNVRLRVSDRPAAVADYGVASGIFNVRQGRSDEAWLAYIKSTLDILDQTSARGFAFNCLTRYSDAHKMREELYYADPCELFDHCKKHYSRQVALLHDYGLYEFTILVRKPL